MPALKIFIAGLCTILNARGELSSLPDPSVILVRTGDAFGHTAVHTPFVAWDTNKVTAVATTGAITEKLVNQAETGKFKYFEPDGEQIDVKNDMQGPPRAASFGGIASYFQFSRNPPSIDWNRCYIPKKGDRPTADCVAAFMIFGGGILTSAKATPFKLEFRDLGGTTTVASPYSREVDYVTTTPIVDDGGKPSVTLSFKSLASGALVREVKFTAMQANSDIEIYIGNDTESNIRYAVDRWKRELPNPKPAALHFHALLMEINGNPDAPIPFRTDVRVKNMRVSGPGGGDTGYCGPDGIP